MFGGSFDPPHDGHRRLALAALKALQVDFVWWLVAPQNPLKAHQPGAMATRLAATRTCAAHPRFLVSDEETRLGTRYACDTIRALKARHPGVDFIWLIGADNLAQLHRWKDWQGLMHEVPLAVYPRPTKTLKALAAPAAQRFARARLATQDAARLARRKTPAWTWSYRGGNRRLPPRPCAPQKNSPMTLSKMHIETPPDNRLHLTHIDKRYA